MATYKRKKNDNYPSAPWTGTVLVERVPILKHLRVWEPAAGKKKLLAGALRDAGCMVATSDIITGTDFLATTSARGCKAIVTNCPYSMADDFVHHAIDLMDDPMGMVAFLFYSTFDNAKGRVHSLFPCGVEGCNKCDRHAMFFERKIVLTQRMLIPGFKHKASPMKNHAWYVWNCSRSSFSPRSTTDYV